MLDIELRICQKLAKEFNLDVREIEAIERSQFKLVTKLIRELSGKAFGLPYLGEFCLLPKMERYLEVARERRLEETKVEE